MPAISLTRFGQLPAVCIRAADGAQALVTLYGAHLVSWQSADGQERLFCSARSAKDGSRAIRGGVPVIFPQFNERGPGMRHGFARVSHWRLADSGSADGGAFALFALTPNELAPAIAAAWPHAFALRLRVSVAGGQLDLAFEVENRGAEAFAFSAALHSYHRVERIEDVRIEGVQAAALSIAAKLDQIFYAIDGPITVHGGAGVLQLEQTGFTDAVVWNPGAADAAAMADLEDEEYRRFVCIEPALIAPATLVPGAKWRGTHRVRAD